MRIHKKVERNWGTEVWIENNEHYCGKLMIAK